MKEHLCWQPHRVTFSDRMVSAYTTSHYRMVWEKFTSENAPSEVLVTKAWLDAADEATRAIYKMMENKECDSKRK